MHSVKLILLVAVMIFVSACTSMPRIYSGDEVHGWVVDSETKQPIKDVIVVERWELEGGFHSDHTANIHIAETVTDENGYYSFSDWGPRLTIDGTMSESSPRLVFYKFGYDDVSLSNRVSGNLNQNNTISEHTDKKIELKKFNGTPKEYYDAVDSIEYILKISHYRSSFDCMWTKIPRFTAEMVYLNEYISNQRSEYAIKTYPSMFLNNLSDLGCEDPKQVLKEYLK